jgi:hypothetical protein
VGEEEARRLQPCDEDQAALQEEVQVQVLSSQLGNFALYHKKK